MDKTRRYLILIFLIFLAYAWVSLFTTIQQRQFLLRNLQFDIQSNPNIPKITEIPVTKQGECNKEVDNPDYDKFIQAEIERCIKEKPSTSHPYANNKVDLTKIYEINCRYKAETNLSAPKAKIQTVTSCNVLTGYDKWITLFNIHLFKIGWRKVNSPNLNHSTIQASLFDSENQIVRQEDTADVTGDGKPEGLFVTIGKGCASCHQNWIYVYSGEQKLFETTGDDASIAVMTNGKGFSIKQPVRKSNESLCCPSEYKTDEYIWNGTMFTKQ